MSRFIEMWEPILQSFEQKYPHIADIMTDWYPGGRNEIVVQTSKSERFSYNYVGDKIVKLDDREELRDETEWREKFAERLCYKMMLAGIEQWKLSQLTGISEVSLSKYMNGRTTPSGYNIERIARALNCSASELTNI